MRKPLMIMMLLTVAFHCLVGCSDGIDMDVVNVNNLDGATGVPIDSKFQYIASPAFDSSTVTGETYFIVPVTGNSASISAKAAMDDTICDLEGALPAAQSSAISTFFGLIPSGVLSYNTQYAICLTEGIAYENGSAFGGFMARFTTAESSSEVTTTLSPAEGATGVALDAAVTAVFSGEITEPADWSSLFTLKLDGAGDSLCTSVTYDSSTLTATCEHADFGRSSVYTVEVSRVTDPTGAAITTASTSFSSAPTVKLLRLDGTVLELTDRPIPLSARIQYTLGEALTEESQRAAFEASVSVTDESDADVTGAYAWAADYMSTVFTPSSKLGYSSEYTITMDPSAMPVLDLTKAVGTEMSFTTMAYRDINGDGYADAVIGAPGVAGGAKNGELYVFLSSGTGGVADCDLSGSCTADTTILGAAANDLLGHSFSIGDINADGYADVIAGGMDYWTLPNAGWVYVFLGSADGIADCDLSGSCTPDTTIAAATAGSYLGTSVSAGDVNGDGYDDLMVGAVGIDAFKGVAYVFLGSAGGIADCDLSGSCTADAVIAGAAADEFLGVSISAGDVNNDGYDDIIVSAPGVPAGDWRGETYVFLGSAEGVASCDLSAGCVADTTITGATDWAFLGNSVSTAGDVNGDGYDDLIVGEPYTLKGNAYVFLGSATGIGDCNLSAGCIPDATITGAVADDSLGFSVSAAGDVDNDGYEDVIVGSVWGEGAKGEAYILSGAAAGIADCTIGGACPSLSATITGAAVDDYLGDSVSMSGDVNNDGYQDVAVGAVGAGGNKGKGYILLGAAAGIADCAIGGVCPSLNAMITGKQANDTLGYVR